MTAALLKLSFAVICRVKAGICRIKLLSSRIKLLPGRATSPAYRPR